MATIKYKDIFEVDQRLQQYEKKLIEFHDVITDYSVMLTQVHQQYFDVLKKISGLQNQIIDLKRELKESK